MKEAYINIEEPVRHSLAGQTSGISQFTLERFRLGELDIDEKEKVLRALAADEGLRSAMRNLEESDRQLLNENPFEKLNLPATERQKTKAGKFRFTGRTAIIAAAASVCVIFSVLFFMRNSLTNQPAINALSAINGEYIAGLPNDRVKGIVRSEAELSLYLKGQEQIPVPDMSRLYNGNTIQLAYALPAGNDRYGVIFSIDGRSQVTMHFPYRMGQSSLLVSGRKTFLNEAYTLDDAPDFEIFIMVISEEPLDAGTVMKYANALAADRNFNETDIRENTSGIFSDYDITTVTILKNSSKAEIYEINNQ